MKIALMGRHKKLINEEIGACNKAPVITNLMKFSLVVLLPLFSLQTSAAAPGTIWNSFLGYFDTADEFCRALAATNLGNPYSTFTYQYADAAGNCYWTRIINGSVSPVFSSNYAFLQYYCLGLEDSKKLIDLDASKSFAQQCPDLVPAPEPLPTPPPAVCPVSPLTPLTDPHSISFENGNKKRPDLLTPDFQTKLRCVQNSIAALGGTSDLSSAWRPGAYQNHLFEIVKKDKTLDPEYMRNFPECQAIRDDISNEMQYHELKRGQKVAPQGSSRHESGQAFDLTPIGLTQIQLSTIYSNCGVRRNAVPSEPWHVQ